MTKKQMRKRRNLRLKTLRKLRKARPIVEVLYGLMPQNSMIIRGNGDKAEIILEK